MAAATVLSPSEIVATDALEGSLFEASRHGVPPPVSAPLEAQAAADLGTPLPEALLVVLRRQNGGFLARGAHSAPANSWASDHVPVESLPGIWEERSSWHGVPELRALQKQRPATGCEGLVLLTGEEDKGWVALETVSGHIVFQDVVSNARLVLAESMGAFLEGLISLDGLRAAAAEKAATAAMPMEELPPAGWGMAALLGSDLEDDDEEDDEDFAGGMDDGEDEEFVDEELLPYNADGAPEEQQQAAVPEIPVEEIEEALVLPPGKKRRQ